jgi:mono/diheme cytochrome c family protein
MVCLGSLLVAVQARAEVDFAREVQPIFAARCYSCHGPQARVSGLRLDNRESVFRGGDSGVPAVVPGKSAESILIRYVTAENPKAVMPPSGPRLTSSEIEVLRRWIDEGARWPAESATPDNIDFAADILPILETRCFECHGRNRQTHGLRLDLKSAAFKGGDSGVPAIVPGNSAQSLLIRYVAGLDPKIVMPAAGPRLTAGQVRALRTWIDQGARWPDDARGALENSGTRDKRDHWAFRPRTRPVIPTTRSGAARNPIDAFVIARLEEKGWKPARPATNEALMRRIYLDLTGLPPRLDEQDQFLAHPDAAKLVDELLARPAYGERWGRHWLDLVRYAESNGYERDAAKPFAWRYRDYVIRAFNEDKPYDRFILEQLAGDELEDRDADTLIATSYYRLGPWDDEPADEQEDRFDQLEDIVSTTSQVFMGLTLGCARCHNHKFEPLTARDYYSMVAIFNGLERPHEGRTELAVPIGTPAELDVEARRDSEIEPLQKQIATIRNTFRADFLSSGRSGLPAEAVQAFLTEPAKRDAAQRSLVNQAAEKLEKDVTNAIPAETASQIASLEARIAGLKKQTPDLPRAYLMAERSPTPPVTHLLIRGKAAVPGPEVPPAVPAILADRQPEFPTLSRTSGRRLGLARWLASSENPLTARIIVNRIWQFHFGDGIVRTPSDFGVMGDRPTHSELLDWLANWFVENGWSIKKLHRLIMSSDTYRMSRDSNPEYLTKDPENRLMWRNGYRRLEVEAILDSALAVSGRLNRKMNGPSMYPFIPKAALEGSSDPDKIWQPFDENEASRRTVYAFIKRSLLVPTLEVLDFCDTARSSARRLNTSVATQALTLFNGDFMNRQAGHFAQRLRREAGEDPDRQVELAYRLALARRPTTAEKTRMLSFLGAHGGEDGLVQLCRVIFNLNEFVYPE